jgi:hypothetical protein
MSGVCVSHVFEHISMIIILVGKLFFVSPKQLVKTGLDSYNTLAAVIYEFRI